MSDKTINVLVIIMATFLSIGLYGTLREADTNILSSAAICVTYGVGFHHIMYRWFLP